ncbi:MAG: FAD-dependent oxidoreductase [Proteobacteria bacterium]|nr:FAD-dependent oxidoreductase [Pseudomonadota bacterium]
MKTVVIGGGPAGCAAAYTLRKQGHTVDLFEASDRLGGRTKQLYRDGFNLGTGALFLMGGIYPRTMALLKEMNHYKDLVPWQGSAELADEDDARYPVRFDSIASFLGLPVLQFRDKLRLVSEGLKLFLSPGPKNPFNGSELARFDVGENLEDWSRRHLGDRAHEYIMRPIVDFLYAVPLRELSTPFPKAIIQQAWKLALSVPPGGIGQVSEWLVESLPGESIHLPARSSGLSATASDGGCSHMAGTMRRIAWSSQPKRLLRPGSWVISSAPTRNADSWRHLHRVRPRRGGV